VFEYPLARNDFELSQSDAIATVLPPSISLVFVLAKVTTEQTNEEGIMCEPLKRGIHKLHYTIEGVPDGGCFFLLLEKSSPVE
jgi:hypothetical protein